MRTDLDEDPAVVGVATALGVSPSQVVGLLWKLWSIASRQTSNGCLPHYSLDTVDRLVGHAGFAAALEAAGWLHSRRDSLEIPNFDRWMSESAKKRFKEALKKRNQRARDGPHDRGHVSPQMGDKSGTGVLSSSVLSCASEDEESEATPVPLEKRGPMLGGQCIYCGSTEEQTGWPHEMDHFIPEHAGGPGGQNTVKACHQCNQAKSGRRFATIEDCRLFLHVQFWSKGRKRYRDHRKYAFGGVEPTDEQYMYGTNLEKDTRPVVSYPEAPTNVMESLAETPATGLTELRCHQDAFEAFYAAYPKKVAKMAAARQWRVINPSREQAEQIIGAVKRQRQWDQFVKGFAPNPAKWLADERWLDEEPPTTSNLKGPCVPVLTEEQRIAKIAAQRKANEATAAKRSPSAEIKSMYASDPEVRRLLATIGKEPDAEPGLNGKSGHNGSNHASP